MRQASSIKTRDRSSLYQTPAYLQPSLTRAVSPSNERRSIRHSYGPASETAPWHSATNSSRFAQYSSPPSLPTMDARGWKARPSFCGVAFDHPVVVGAHHLGHCGDVCLVGPLAHRGLLPVMRRRAYSGGSHRTPSSGYCGFLDGTSVAVTGRPVR